MVQNANVIRTIEFYSTAATTAALIDHCVMAYCSFDATRYVVMAAASAVAAAAGSCGWR